MTILTVIQFCNFIIFTLVGLYQIFGIGLQIALMLMVGMMGGCSYSNCLYQILSDVKLTKTQKELTLAIALLYNDFGILFASIFSLLITTWIAPVN